MLIGPLLRFLQGFLDLFELEFSEIEFLLLIRVHLPDLLILRFEISQSCFSFDQCPGFFLKLDLDILLFSCKFTPTFPPILLSSPSILCCSSSPFAICSHCSIWCIIWDYSPGFTFF